MGTCGGNDCNDHDPRVNPDAGMTFDQPDAFPSGDWNCDGTVDFAYPILSCTLNLVNCNAGAGFTTFVGCGSSGSWDDCSGLCNKTDAGARTQGCR